MLALYRRKLITGLITLEILFLLVFAFAFINLVNQRAIIDVGLSASIINGIVIVFSIISMINIVYELFKVK